MKFVRTVDGSLVPHNQIVRVNDVDWIEGAATLVTMDGTMLTVDADAYTDLWLGRELIPAAPGFKAWQWLDDESGGPEFFKTPESVIGWKVYNNGSNDVPPTPITEAFGEAGGDYIIESPNGLFYNPMTGTTYPSLESAAKDFTREKQKQQKAA